MKILIADDELITRSYLKRMLEKLGHEVIECSDGEEAWEHLSSNDPPKLSVLDWMMPKISGPTLCRDVRALAKGKTLYMILLTSKSNKTDIIEGLSSGADDYIVKPFNKDELKARIDVGVRTVDLRRDLERERDQLLQLSKLVTFTSLAYSNQSISKVDKKPLNIPEMVKQGLDYCQNSVFKTELNIRVVNHVENALVDCHGNTLSQVILTLILGSLELVQHHPSKQLEIQISERGDDIEITFREPMAVANTDYAHHPLLISDHLSNTTISILKNVVESHGGKFTEFSEKNSNHYVLRLPKAVDAKSVGLKAA